MTTDPVVVILRDGITDAEQERKDLQAEISEVNSRIARMRTAITAIGGTTTKTTTATKSFTKSYRKRNKKAARPWFISEGTVDVILKAIAKNGSPTITELSKKTGYSVASIEDATKTLLERKAVTRERVAGEKAFRYTPSGTES